MSKLIQVLLLGIVGLVVLAAAGPVLAKLAADVVMPVVTVGIVAALVRCVWWLTGPK